MLYQIHNLKAIMVLIVVVGRELGYIRYIRGYKVFGCLLPHMIETQLDVFFFLPNLLWVG